MSTIFGNIIELCYSWCHTLHTHYSSNTHNWKYRKNGICLQSNLWDNYCYSTTNFNFNL